LLTPTEKCTGLPVENYTTVLTELCSRSGPL